MASDVPAPGERRVEWRGAKENSRGLAEFASVSGSDYSNRCREGGWLRFKAGGTGCGRSNIETNVAEENPHPAR